jgi:hypothetical protein
MSRRSHPRSRGQALAEFALAVPLFFLVFLGVAEGGYYVVATTIVSHATHEGARYGVLHSTEDRDDIRNRVVERAAPVVALDDTGIILELNGGGSCNDSCYDGRKAGDRLRITTSYTHTPLVGYVFPGLSFALQARSELLVEGAPSA